MRFVVFLVSFFFLSPVFAGDTKTGDAQAPVFEPITEDLSGRLQRLERLLDSKSLLNMLDTLESLEIEVSKLRGEVEVQTHTIEQLKQRQRNLYTDVDQRLQKMETNKPFTEQPDEEDTTETAEEVANEEALTDNEETEAREPADPNKAEAVYQRAFKLLKESQYEQALTAFKDFLKDYPNSDFSDNAQYWIGEANYVMQKYELAINEYQSLLNNYPDSQKISHALLKIGYSYAELGNAADAQKTLQEVKSQFPGTTAARLAEERLRKIKQSNT